MLQRFYRPLTTLALILTGALIALLAMQNATRPASGAGTLSPNVRHTILNVACEGLLTFGNTYAKIVDVGDFEVVGAESTVELTYQGRLRVGSLSGTTGAIFELRVDNQPSTLGRARAHIKASSTGEHVTFSALFPDLEPGTHTASVWVRAFAGTGTDAYVDSGCWRSDAIIVREYAAHGYVFLPMTTEE